MIVKVPWAGKAANAAAVVNCAQNVQTLRGQRFSNEEHSLVSLGVYQNLTPRVKLFTMLKNRKIGFLCCIPHFCIFYGIHLNSRTFSIHDIEKCWINSNRFLVSCFKHEHWCQQDRWCWWYGWFMCDVIKNHLTSLRSPSQTTARWLGSRLSSDRSACFWWTDCHLWTDCLG